MKQRNIGLELTDVKILIEGQKKQESTINLISIVKWNDTTWVNVCR